MISGVDSRNGNGTSSSGTLDYDYNYDYLWRLTEASLPGSESWAEKDITYDRNGNLRSLTRHGGSGSILDALNLSYSGNRLAAVSHSGGTWSYGHDGSGRMTSDGRLGGITVQYGETGLPRKTMGPPGSGITTTEYSYLADGTRLGVAQNKGTSASPSYYGYLNAGSLNVLHNGASVVFESSAFEEGVIYSHGLMYFTRDHLGNTRVVTDGSGTVVERNDYYPFGERHSDSSMPMTNTNRWRFAGKEIQPLGSTGWLDFGARQYDSFLGRWTTVDPLAEKYPGISPYSYCAGNPINFVDREGKFPETLWDFANVVMDVASLVSNIKDHNAGAAIADGVGLVADAFAAAIPFLPAGAGAALKAVRGGEKVADAVKTVDKVGDATKVIERTETVASQGKYGSYTITFESGMKYHGKGPKSRMERSIKEKFELYGDRAISSEWSPAATERDSFIDEALRIRGDGGVGMEYGNYNKINSPGEKMLREKETRR